MKDFKMSVVCTRHNIGQLDEFKAIADRYGAQLRLTRLRPSGRGADVWDELHPLPEQQRELYDWLVAHGDQVLTGDSFFHLSAYGEALPGLNLCGAGRVVCLVDPVGRRLRVPVRDPRPVPGRQRARRSAASTRCGRTPTLFAELRRPQTGGACTKCSAYDSCRGGCMAAKFFTGLPLDGPDPECVRDGGRRWRPASTRPPRSGRPLAHRDGPQRAGAADASCRAPPDRACDENPLAGLRGRKLSDGSWPRDGRARSGLVWALGAAAVAARSTAGRCCSCRSGRSSSTARTCRWRPTRCRRRGDPGGRGAARRAGARCWSRPSVDYGASGEHEGFPGHGLDRPRGAAAAARRSSAGRRAAGRRGGLRQRSRRQRPDARRRPSSCCATRGGPWRGRRALPGADAHAGHTETSLLLALTPAPSVGGAAAGAPSRSPS